MQLNSENKELIMMNISSIHDCYGCGVCSAACRKEIIRMQLNDNGFYEPIISEQSLCIDCGLCLSVCAYSNNLEHTAPLKSYAAWSKDPHQRYISTSGGVSAEIAKFLIREGYNFCGVRFNPSLNITEHYITNNTESLSDSYGSKYLQSYSETAFKEINRKEKNVVVGTPCQIASFRRYIQKYKCEENFILIDFFCHGVPSKLMWEKYLKDNGFQTKNISASWRSKEKGWKNSYCITLDDGEKKHKSWSGKDDFFTMFLGDACLGKACYDHCKFKYDQSAADIRIGDLWGRKFSGNQEGVCAAIAFTERGNQTLNESNIELHEYPFDVVAEGQMRTCAKRPWYYKRAQTILKSPSRKLSEITKYIRLYKTIKRQIAKIKDKLIEI